MVSSQCRRQLGCGRSYIWFGKLARSQRRNLCLSWQWSTHRIDWGWSYHGLVCARSKFARTRLATVGRWCWLPWCASLGWIFYRHTTPGCWLSKRICWHLSWHTFQWYQRRWWRICWTLRRTRTRRAGQWCRIRYHGHAHLHTPRVRLDFWRARVPGQYCSLHIWPSNVWHL